jgi:ATP-dependent DNA helicase PIF1
MQEHAILSTRNKHFDVVNQLMIDRFPGDKHVFYSFYTVDDDTLDFLNSLTLNGLPLHEFTIKRNSSIILLHNLHPHNVLCNGTRLFVKELMKNAIDVEIVDVQHA